MPINFVIRGKEPEEMPVEVWLEKNSNNGIQVMLRKGGYSQHIISFTSGGYILKNKLDINAAGVIGLVVNSENRIKEVV